MVKNQVLNEEIIEIPIHVIEFAFVTASSLNIRTKPTVNSSKAKDRTPLKYGAILRIYDKKDGFLKISNSKNHWVSERYTQKLKKASVTVKSLNIREGAGTNFKIVGKLIKDEIIFVSEEKNNWSKIEMEDNWISSKYIKFL